MIRSPFHAISKTVRNLALASAVVGVSFATVADTARAEDLIVKYDQSQLIRLPRAAAEIIIGNPSIADVAIQTGNLLVVTGKSYGVTNIIALDSERNVIQDQRILVRRDERSVVHIVRGTARQTYACVPQCNPTITLGDDISAMRQIKEAADLKINFSSKAASDAPEGGAPSQ
ncbi:MAG TPA: pilus assembly protein N-terminal domain-containing protein [Hyphomicrobiaceae bacterium]|nr:pilus assembly protein N-terminal domain-containing protein [Hyphomicrobiaceae bacterium]